MNTQAKHVRRPGRPKSEAKAEAIREAAGQLFLTEGMNRTSMDAIAQAAGVSKQTVYSHFHSKDDLFRSCVCSKVEDYGLNASQLDSDAPLSVVLHRIGTKYLTLLCDPEVIAMFRLMVAEANAFPNVVRNFHEAGPQATTDSVTGLFAKYLPDADDECRACRAATEFLALVRADYFPQLIMGIRKDIPETEMRDHVDRCIRQIKTLYPELGTDA